MVCMESKMQDQMEAWDRQHLEALAWTDLAIVRDWLASLGPLDMDDIVADGGITAGMVVQQQAREILGKMQRALGILNPPDAGRAALELG